MPEPDSLETAWRLWLASVLLGYLLGSIPFGLLLTRMVGLGDIRNVGSGNIGATNVLRTGRKGLAAATLVLDALKGTAAVLIAARWGPTAALAAGFAAFLGHCFPVWLRFKGGKGVATFLGILLGLHWPTMILTAVIWIGTAALTRYSSLSALIAAAAAPVVLLLFGRTNTALLVAILAVIVWARHKDNLKRLMAGEEARIGRA
ncbi:MAG: glycerol-3-phosphate 1-O-acyltransferase PlsY [Pseudomonadota bacterium]|nr:glycerol-3-phosphate 1-O-acyltransferase PlsY [Pseudomonadota bacterium]